MENPVNLSAKGQKLLHFIEFDADEEIVREIYKHPVGQLLIYMFGIFVTVVILAATGAGAFFLKGDLLGNGSNASSLRPVLIIAGLIMGGLSIGITFIAAFIYRSNRMLVTSEKVVQVIYKNIIDRKISQLSIADVQDVTVNQTGILSRIFHFGTIVIETAGEQMNYSFTFTPDPYECAKSIVGAHERNAAKFGN